MIRRALAASLAVGVAWPAFAGDTRISDVPLASSLAGTETVLLVMPDGLTLKRATTTMLTSLTAWNQWKGAWSGATAYVVNDAVSYNGASYIAIQAGTNHLPTDTAYWQVIAAKGTDGAGTGTVTSVTCGTGLSGGAITASGTCAIVAPIPVGLGGTNATAASGIALDNITGFASNGFIKRTGSGTYAFVADPLPVANGGLGIASGTSGGVPCFTAATTIASSAQLGANYIVLGGGAGACPTLVGSLGTTTTVLHGNAAGAPSFGALAYADIASGTLATTAEWRSNTASKIATPAAIWGGAAPVALTDAATIAVDLSTGVNFSVTLGGSRILGAPTNTKAGQTGAFRVSQDGTGSRTLAYNAVYKWAVGAPCVLSTAASKIDYLFYFVYSSSEIMMSCTLDVR